MCFIVRSCVYSKNSLVNDICCFLPVLRILREVIAETKSEIRFE